MARLLPFCRSAFPSRHFRQTGSTPPHLNLLLFVPSSRFPVFLGGRSCHVAKDQPVVPPGPLSKQEISQSTGGRRIWRRGDALPALLPLDSYAQATRPCTRRGACVSFCMQPRYLSSPPRVVKTSLGFGGASRECPGDRLRRGVQLMSFYGCPLPWRTLNSPSYLQMDGPLHKVTIDIASFLLDSERGMQSSQHLQQQAKQQQQQADRSIAFEFLTRCCWGCRLSSSTGAKQFFSLFLLLFRSLPILLLSLHPFAYFSTH